jgi:hypothetical protein
VHAQCFLQVAVSAGLSTIIILTIKNDKNLEVNDVLTNNPHGFRLKSTCLFYYIVTGQFCAI